LIVRYGRTNLIAKRRGAAYDAVERWLKGKAERAAALPGATNVTDLVAMDGSNHAAVAFDIDDPDALMAVLSSVPRRWPPRRSHMG
jgi:muconolactone delta-isomerase